MADTVTIKKITDLPENTDANDADLFMQGVNGTASLRKIKWSTILAKIKSKLLANNLTTTQEGYALDARQGKALSDQINALNTKTLQQKPDITSGDLLQKTTEQGIYRYSGITSGAPDSWDTGVVIALSMGNWIGRLAITAAGGLYTSIYQPGSSYGTLSQE